MEFVTTKMYADAHGLSERTVKMFYCRGLREWNHVPGYLMDTCLTAQDHYKALLDYFKIAWSGKND